MGSPGSSATATPRSSGVPSAIEEGALGRGAGCAELHRTPGIFHPAGQERIRQANVTGLVAAAFTHRDSRGGDPDLHTHDAVGNKVPTLDGSWLLIDGRVLFKAAVAASETSQHRP